MCARRRFQFSLRTLFVVMTSWALLLALLRTLGVGLFMSLASTALVGAAIVAAVLLFRQGVISAAAADPLSPTRVATVPSDVHAAVLVETLQEAGIRATAVGGHTSAFQAEAPGAVHVVVARQDLDRARQVLAEARDMPT